MPAEFNKDRCQQRNRIAARRDGVEASPFVFLRAAPALTTDLWDSWGALPADDSEALAWINARLPADSPALTAEQVYIHYCEAANTAYIGERDIRPMFLGKGTLRNIAADAIEGVAFMNSHRTGGLSHEAEQPMGRTFAARYEEFADGRARVLVGFYMVAGTAPNGANGPTTDDLHKQIAGGTLFDVSVGLGKGEKVCDLCGFDLERKDEEGRYLCPHVPGTSRHVTPEQQTAQQARGVSKGVATYTLENAHCGEISGVYDGAVPGAGFAKALRLARELSPAERLEVRAAYSTLLRRGDLPMDDIRQMVEEGFSRALARFNGRPVPGVFEEALAPVVLQEAQALAPDPRIVELETQLAAERQQRAADNQARWASEAQSFATRLVEQGRLLPAQAPAFIALYAQLAADDSAAPASVAYTTTLGAPQAGDRAAALAAVFGTAPPHALFGERVKGDAVLTVLPATVLSPEDQAADDDAKKAEAYAASMNKETPKQ